MSPSVDHAHGLPISPDQYNQNGEQEREATELHQYDSTSAHDVNRSSTRSDQSGSSRGLLKTFWKRHVVATVQHESCRDHFGMLQSYSQDLD